MNFVQMVELIGFHGDQKLGTLKYEGVAETFQNNSKYKFLQQFTQVSIMTHGFYGYSS